ncbi:MAG: ammonia-forming cytochrome c nitrite reductase subunit c552 [Anaerolineales bacterium]|nr:ammonia-forming cytochrome c nitrite reductase subunit c552 [Anaerolineales bacterium]NUQ85950.1 ammonia-forming cytochrome c nitrite reductase subunit c552 [Anaerolineales bacterium]
MKKPVMNIEKPAWMTFSLVFAVCLAVGVAISLARPASAAPSPAQGWPGETGYATSETCSTCHRDIHETWSGTLHSQAFSSPIFQEDWVKQGLTVSCLECHTTGFDSETGEYAEEGVACEACHGPMQQGHPTNPMPITPDYTLCAKCHKTTTDEWQASKHGQVSLDCEACHNPHSQEPRAETVTELCTNCHKDTGTSFTHGTHANSGLSCSDCHMSATSHTASTGGLFATGHTFMVGSEACINCHKDTVHTRDTIVKLSGEQTGEALSAEELEKLVSEKEQAIQSLEAQNTVRLYTGLIQGSIVGLIVGGVAAWVVSQRIRIVEVEENDDTEEKK